MESNQEDKEGKVYKQLQMYVAYRKKRLQRDMKIAFKNMNSRNRIVQSCSRMQDKKQGISFLMVNHEAFYNS